eukprot:9473760-Pyramimonas_sp.AAC.1
MFNYYGTVVPVLLHCPLMWACLGLFFAIRVVEEYYDEIELQALTYSEVAIMGGFLSFFLVFFAGQSYTRHLGIYNQCMGLEARIFDATFLAKQYLPLPRAIRVLRYMNAAQMLGYVGLSTTYNEENFMKHLNEKNRFLSELEYARMLEIGPNVGGSCYREVLHWCLTELENSRTAKEIDEKKSLLQDKVIKLRQSLGALFDYADQPITFFHVHLIYLFSVLYLPLFTYASAVSMPADANFGNEFVHGFLVFAACCFVIGVRALAQKLADPFGHEEEDLSVMHYINFTWKMSRRVLLSKNPSHAFDEEMEYRLFKESLERAPIGAPWGHSASDIASPRDHDIPHMEEHHDNKIPHLEENPVFEADVEPQKA